MKVRFETIRFEPRDLWIGLYWKPQDRCVTFYLCLIPCLPIIWSVWKKEEK